MQNPRTFLRFIDLTSEWVGKVVSFIIILMIGAIIWDVVLRSVFVAPAMWGMETYGKFFVVYITCGAAYALLTRAFINVDILYRRFPLRVRGIVDLVTSILFFTFCIVLLWYAVPPAVGEALMLNLSPRLLAPQGWPVSLLVAIGVFLFLLQGVAKFVRDLIIAITGKEVA